MKFRIGILLDSFQLSLDQSLRIAADLGVDGVQMYASSNVMSSLQLNFRHAKQLRKKIADYDLEMASLCGDIGGHGFERKSENKDRIKKTCEIIDFAVELGTTVITTHIGVVSETDAAQRMVIQDALHEICRYVEKRGVFIAIETGPEKAKTLKEFIVETGEKSLKVNFDPANLVMVQGENPAKAVLALGDYIVHTHAKDGKMVKKCDPVTIYNAFAEGNPENINMDNYFVELPLGTGDVDFPEYLRVLESIGYSGYLTIEREAGQDRIKDICEGVEFLKSQVIGQ